MDLILELIPHEIVDNYKISNPENINGDAKAQSKNTTKLNGKKEGKRLGRPRR